jgi:CheY-like chemotaxis protein
LILLVDDDPVFLEAAEPILNRDHHLFLALSAGQALNLIRAVGFSVALVDVDLPGGGLALIRQIHATCPETGVIAIGSARERLPAEAAKSAGAVEVLCKPATPEWQTVVDRVEGDLQ